MLFRNKFYAILLAYMPYGRAYVNSIDIYSLRHKNAVIIRAVQTHTFIFHLLVPRYLGQPKKKKKQYEGKHSPRRPVFMPRSVHVEFVVNEVAFG